MDLPAFNASSAVESGKRKLRAAAPWLPSFECKACGTYCEAGWTWDRLQAGFNADEYGNNGEAPTWDCPNPDCGKKWRRGETGGYTAEIWDR